MAGEKVNAIKIESIVPPNERMMLPRTAAKAFNLKAGETITVSANQHCIVIERIQQNKN